MTRRVRMVIETEINLTALLIGSLPSLAAAVAAGEHTRKVRTEESMIQKPQTASKIACGLRAPLPLNQGPGIGAPTPQSPPRTTFLSSASGAGVDYQSGG